MAVTPQDRRRTGPQDAPAPRDVVPAATDTTVWPLLQILKGSMLEQITDSGLGPFCFAGIMPGQLVALEYVDNCGDQCGMAWVRLASIQEVASQLNGGFSSCSSEFVANIEMGMVRCHQTAVDESAEPMPLDYQEAKAEAQMAEMAAMKRALICDAQVQTNFDILLGQYNAIGPQGGVVGGAWTAQFHLV